MDVGDLATSGTCSSTPEHVPYSTVDGEFMALTCSENKQRPCKGNFIAYGLQNGDSHLYIKNVNAEYCKPKPEACHCNRMLDNILAKYSELDEIEGFFMANPFMAGCKCYLGAAARAGFKYVQFESTKKKCNKKNKINIKNYGKVCKKYNKMSKKCAYSLKDNLYGKGFVTKF